MKKYGITSVLFILLVSCIGSVNEKSITNNSLVGYWATINPENIYYEIEITDSLITFYSYDDEGFGPFAYHIEEDTLRFFNLSFLMKSINKDRIVLITKNGKEMVLEKLFLNDKEKPDSRAIFLRRSVFLMNKNLISVDSAYNSISGFKPLEPNMQEEEIKIIRN